MRELVDEEHALVRLVDRSRDHAFVGQRAQLRMASIRVVAYVAEQFGLAGTRGHEERVPVQFDQHLPGALLLEGPAPFERPLVEDLDLFTGPFVRHDLLGAVPEPGRPN
jgi:hypothetical protein